MHLRLLAACSLVAFVTAFPSEGSVAGGLSRRVGSPNLFLHCEGEKPTGAYPSSFSSRLFRTIEDFCGPQGLGYECHEEGDPEYVPAEGHEVLDRSFPDSCLCQCYSNEPTTPRNTDQRTSVSAPGTGSGAANAAAQCSAGANCTGAGDCGDSCACSSVATMQVDSLGNIVYSSGCTQSVVHGVADMSLSPRADVPPLDLPCPCNASYVSYACCAAPAGLVHEPRDMKLGVLMT